MTWNFQAFLGLLAVVFTVVAGISTFFLFELNFWRYMLLVAWILVLVAISLGAIISVTNNKQMPIAYSIAVIGFPQVGKSTLIHAIFEELLDHRPRDVEVFLRGEETIKRVHDGVEKLTLGQKIGPTTDQDVFAFRCEVIRGKFFKTRYRVEIGDFPGEKSETFTATAEYGDEFHKAPYFKWAMEATAFILIIDLAPVLGTKEYEKQQQYIAKMQTAIRKAWHHLSEYHLEGKRKIRLKPLVLVFSKADLLLLASPEEVGKYAFESIPPVKTLDTTEAKKLEESKKQIEQSFASLIDFFNNESDNFGRVFTSCFLKTEIKEKNKHRLTTDERLGINELLEKLLPK